MEKMSKGLVSIIIVTAGVQGHLKTLLDSIERQTHQASETIIIDNSINGIAITLPKWAKLYTNGKNLFYCQALNLGVKESKGEFILCLNDDVVLGERFIKEALKGFFISPKIGMVSGKIMRSDKKILDSTGLFLSILFTATERGYGALDKGRFEREQYIFGVNGAVAFYRRKMLEDIKINSDYFDEDYRIFYEDLDIAWRAQNFGWRGYYMPKAVAFHARGATVRGSAGVSKPYARHYLSDDLHLDLLKNRYITIIKNASFISLFIHLPFIFIYDLASLVYIILFRKRLTKKMPLNFKYLKVAVMKRKIIKNMQLFQKK
ncbi:MAG: glycosyltransferase [Candidatus Omnitrophica bacterium]|nr:glycosyltransferase [Candidatus Omnitrophota bacterium]